MTERKILTFLLGAFFTVFLHGHLWYQRAQCGSCGLCHGLSFYYKYSFFLCSCLYIFKEQSYCTALFAVLCCVCMSSLQVSHPNHCCAFAQRQGPSLDLYIPWDGIRWSILKTTLCTMLTLMDSHLHPPGRQCLNTI